MRFAEKMPNDERELLETLDAFSFMPFSDALKRGKYSESPVSRLIRKQHCSHERKGLKITPRGAVALYMAILNYYAPPQFWKE